MTLNLDIGPLTWKPLAAQIQWTRLSGAVASTDDRHKFAPLAALTVGMRYESTFGILPMHSRCV